MAARNDFGLVGEEMTSEWLEQRGFQLICQSRIYARFYIDTLSLRIDILAVAEVKSRYDNRFGNRVVWVNQKKKAFNNSGLSFFETGFLHDNRFRKPSPSANAG